MKMKATNNNDITDYYLALFSSINCATVTDNRNKKKSGVSKSTTTTLPSIQANVWFMLLMLLWLIYKCVSAECALSIPIKVHKRSQHKHKDWTIQVLAVLNSFSNWNLFLQRFHSSWLFSERSYYSGHAFSSFLHDFNLSYSHR